MAVTADLPTLATVLVTAIVDSINPCAIGVLILLVSVLMTKLTKGKMIKIGLTYIGAVFIVYFVAGLGLLTFLSNIPIVITQYIAMAIALLVIGLGILEVKDFFWYGQGASLAIPKRYTKKVEHLVKRSHKLTLAGVIGLGAFVAAVELPCTGGPYLAITTVLAERGIDMLAILLLLLYNLIFVAPLVIILLLVLGGKNLTHVKAWKDKYRPHMRLATGLVLIGLGWFLLLLGGGIINLA